MLSKLNVKLVLLKLRAIQLTLAGPWEFPVAGFSLPNPLAALFPLPCSGGEERYQEWL